MGNFLSRIALSVISFLFYRRVRSYEAKLEILKQILGLRFVLVSDCQGVYIQQEGEFFAAINRIPIVFSKSSSVLEEFHKFQSEVNLKMLTMLVEKICQELRISHEDIRLHVIFEKPINPAWHQKSEKSSVNNSSS